MKYATVLAAIAAVASAQSACEKSAEAIPPCALGYLASAASSIANCGIVDFQCQCSHSSAVQAAIQNTVISQCGNSIGAVLNGAGALCSCASSNPGQTISLDPVEKKCQASAFAIDPCGLGYVADAANSVAGCALYDFECQCSHQSAVISAANAMGLSSACPGTRAGNVLASAAALCQCVSSGGSSGPSSTSAIPTSSGPIMQSSSMGPSSSGPTSSGSMIMPTGNGTSPTTGPTSSITQYTGAAAALPTVAGGLMAAVAGLVAYL